MSAVATGSSDDSSSEITGLLTLLVHCSSDIGRCVTQDGVKHFTAWLRKTYPGEKFQWSFIIPLLQTASSDVTQNGDTSSTDNPYAGPECCLTLPAACPDGVGWPDRTTSTVPTVYAELILTSGSNIDYRAYLCQLRKNIVLAITTYLCPKGQPVWVTVTNKQIPVEDCYSRGVENV